jgi:hypothetical protein
VCTQLATLFGREDATTDSLVAFAARQQELWKTRGTLRLKNALFVALRKAVLVAKPSSAHDISVVIRECLALAVQTGVAQGRECRFFLIAVTDLIRHCGLAHVSEDECAEACCSLFQVSVVLCLDCHP